MVSGSWFKQKRGRVREKQSSFCNTLKREFQGRSAPAFFLLPLEIHCPEKSFTRKPKTQANCRTAKLALL